MIGSSAIKLLRRSKLARATAERELSLLKPSVPQGDAGFTLLEMLVVVIIIGAIAAIAVPSWLVFINQRRVNAANDTILKALQDAQSQAKTKKVSYSASFRNRSGASPEIAVYATQQPVTPSTTNPSGVQNVTPSDPSFNGWQNLGQNSVPIKPGQVGLWTNIGGITSNNNQTNQVVRSTLSSNTDIGTITFDETGALSKDTSPTFDTGSNPNLTNPKGLIVMVAVPNGNTPIPSTQRCIKILNLLGSSTIQRGTQCNF